LEYVETWGEHLVLGVTCLNEGSPPGRECCGALDPDSAAGSQTVPDSRHGAILLLRHLAG
jgi:hypothetical protein